MPERSGRVTPFHLPTPQATQYPSIVPSKAKTPSWFLVIRCFYLRQRRRRDFYDLDTSHWRLTGAARPADSLPGAGGTELVNEREPWEAGEDLFEKLGGKDKAFYEGPEACREYLGESFVHLCPTWRVFALLVSIGFSTR